MYSLYVNDDLKAVYICIPKCGSTFIHGVLEHSAGFHSVKVETMENYKDYYIFTFIRCPFKRIVSSYTYLPRIKDANDFFINNNITSFQDFLDKKDLIQTSFDSNSLVYTHSFKLQTEFLKGITLNYVGNIDNCKEDLAEIFKQINFTDASYLDIWDNFIRNNSCSENHYSFYTCKSICDVYNYFKDDIDYFISKSKL